MRKLSVLILLVVVTACAPSATTGASVILGDGTLDLTSNTYQAGDIDLAVTNAGEFAHTLVISEQTGRVVFASQLIGASESVDIRIDLDPGEYQFSCRIVSQLPDGSILDHYEAGMRADVEVGT